MRNSFWSRLSAFLVVTAMMSCASAAESQDEAAALREQIELMQLQLLEMQRQLDALQADRDAAKEKREQAASRLAEVEESEAARQPVAEFAADAHEEEKPSGIHIGGAVRFTYKYEDYSEPVKRRGGVFEMDTIRLNFDGSIGDVLLSAELRRYDYMDVVHHAWVGYDFTDSLQGQIGVNKVPFGASPYTSHSFFFSSNYYVGLEDDHDFGLKLVYADGPLSLQGAFYLNDEHGAGGPGGAESYSYNIVGARAPGEGTFAEPVRGAFDHNIVNGRVAYTFGHDTDHSTEIGLSGQYGGVVDEAGRSNGDQHALAAHLVGNYGPWNLQLQATRYEYDMDEGWDRMAVGAYAFYDTIASRATIYTGNVAYRLPVSWGPITNLLLYNDYSRVTDKSAGLADTWMNATGVAITAGGLFAYIDIVNARNQPFIGGTMDALAGSRKNTRFNFNFGYYF